ncbi:hypothetical protein P691DRAFT_400711 [Macrolepiota fuliginosa MF-IS2]|uniref:Uncharacterized protein n=1 Tax=Macrolepiota fuliginosa MF-IS2 TaxID=1400762 RepID=A0A9P5XK26_9AGAR|nr:hypothetical protein P691DRAFT_400711 [Macrolepiota fuliginosa MF-IS2]
MELCRRRIHQHVRSWLRMLSEMIIRLQPQYLLVSPTHGMVQGNDRSRLLGLYSSYLLILPSVPPRVVPNVQRLLSAMISHT